VTDIPLWAAATLAYKEVFSTRRGGDPSNDELDLVALVLSGYLPVYVGGVALADGELDQGMFWGGARRFESRRAAPRAPLTVRSLDLERALARIRADV
jgi:hypothetical protein